MDDLNKWLGIESETSYSQKLHTEQNNALMFYQQIAKGDEDSVLLSVNRGYFASMVHEFIFSDDPIQNLKYLFVTDITIIARVCVENGMELEKSFRMSEYYVHTLDNLTDRSDILNLYSQMVINYVRHMKQQRQRASLPKPVKECLNYIYSNVRDRITIEDLAEYTNTSTNYISKLFKDELGISASDYIRNMKLDAAKTLLRMTDYSMVEITNYLSFSSQSHFIQLFQKDTGMTPKKYRELYYGTFWKGTEFGINPDPDVFPVIPNT